MMIKLKVRQGENRLAVISSTFTCEWWLSSNVHVCVHFTFRDRNSNLCGRMNYFIVVASSPTVVTSSKHTFYGDVSNLKKKKLVLRNNAASVAKINNVCSAHYEQRSDQYVDMCQFHHLHCFIFPPQGNCC